MRLTGTSQAIVVGQGATGPVGPSVPSAPLTGPAGCFVYDLFERTIAVAPYNSGGGWGQADAGSTWSSTSQAGTPSLGVQNGLAIAQGGGNGATVEPVAAADASYAVVQSAPWTMTGIFGFDTIDTTQILWLSFGFASSPFTSPDITFEIRTNAGIVAAGNSSYSLGAFFFTAYQYLFRWNYTGTVSQAKVWRAGAAEPAYQVSDASVGALNSTLTATWYMPTISGAVAPINGSIGLLAFNLTIIDSLKRTTSLGQWGGADYAFPSTGFSYGTNVSGTGQVTGGRGVLTWTRPGSGGYTTPSITYVHQGPWAASTGFTITTDFIVTATGGHTQSGIILEMKNTKDAYTLYLNVDYAAQLLRDTNGDTYPITLVLGTKYHLAWKLDYLAAYAYTTVWADGTAQPASPQLTDAMGFFTKDANVDFLYGPLATGSTVDTFSTSFGPFLYCEGS